jgi:tetratricopeptide (TPR) repeat protein
MHLWLDPENAKVVVGEIEAALAAVDPDNAEAWLVRAQVALATQDFRDAEFAATEGSRRAPSNPDVLGVLAEVYLAEGNHSAAEKTFERVSLLQPNEPHWHVRSAWVTLEQGRHEDALRTARALAQEHPNSQSVRDNLAMLLLRDAEDVMTSTSDGSRFVTGKHQIAHINNRVAEVEQLGPLSNHVTRYIDMAKGNATFGKRRRWLAPSGKLVLWGLAWFFLGWGGIVLILSLILGDTLGFWAGLLVNLGIAWMFFERVFPPQWKLNRRVVGHTAGPAR